jgi:DNA invertase Pin-like site-specific DNA recombinase
LREAHRGSGKGRGPGRPPGSPGRRRRAKITEETRAAVRKLVESNKTGAAIAKELKISLPSVQNIKKSLGLVKARAKSGT